MKRTILISSLVLLSLLVIAPVEVFAGVHSVISKKALYLIDGETGKKYSKFKGYSTMNWKDMTRFGFFYAKAFVKPKSVYEFILVAISNSNKDYVEGLWDIRRNGKLVCEGCVGKVYGIDLPIGKYFKLYVGDSKCYKEKWHFSAYITHRFDSN